MRKGALSLSFKNDEKSFVFKIFKFLSWLFGHEKKNNVIKNIRLTSKFVAPQPGKQKIPILILPNSSRGKSNQTMKFGQLREYNMRNIFLEKSYTKCGGETIPRPFLKNQNWCYLWINSRKVCAVYFYWIPSWELSKYIETELQTTCFYLIIAFSKNKKRSGTSPTALFSAWFVKKNLSLAVFY